MADITYCSRYCDNLNCFRNKRHIKSEEFASWALFSECESFVEPKIPNCKTKNFDESSFAKNYDCEWIGGE